jgi:phosphatidylserine decarboxylase
MDIYYIDRKTGEKKKEIVAGEAYIKWIYKTRSGSFLLESVFKRKLFSLLYGYLQDLSLSKKKISSFIKDLDIDMSESEEEPEQYKTFNAFFARRLKKDARPVSSLREHLISPADGRLLAYEKIDIEQMIQVKGQEYSLEELFQNRKLAREYQQGVCIVIRLCPCDYHRFHFPDSGIPGKVIKIKGHYYSVNPIALKQIKKVYCQNKREITLFHSEQFGKMTLIEVGATCVGSIVQTYEPEKPVKKGQEKGYFKFGGSTIIMFIKEGIIQVDEDLLQNSLEGLETKVNMGESHAKTKDSISFLLYR